MKIWKTKKIFLVLAFVMVLGAIAFFSGLSRPGAKPQLSRMDPAELQKMPAREVPPLEVFLPAERHVFKIGQQPEFSIDRMKKRADNGQRRWAGIIAKVALAAESSETKIIAAEVVDADGGKVALNPVVDYANGEIKLPFAAGVSAPGKYGLKVRVLRDNELLSATEVFSWGVLAMNFDRSVYEPGQKALIQLASLDEKGSTLCDADLQLEIKNPRGETKTFSVKDGQIRKSGTCGANNVTDNPDYFLLYENLESGIYEVKLANLDKDYSIVDSFQVSQGLPFDIIRSGATRINPFKAEYAMHVKIKAKENWNGDIAENIPDGFGIRDFRISGSSYDYAGASSSKTILARNIAIKKDAEIELSYVYQAVKVSPEWFLLGPLSLKNGGRTVFEEQRQWQLASDALNLPAYKTNTGFNAVSGTSLQIQFPATTAAAGDIAILVVVSENYPVALSVPNGFAEIGNQAAMAAGTAGTDPASRLAVYWKRCVGTETGTTLAPTATSSVSTFIGGDIILFSGVRRTGNPWDAYAQGNDMGANDTSGTIPAATTTVANTLVVLINTTSNDGNSTAQFSGWANSALGGLSEVYDSDKNTGTGGGYAFATGTKLTAGGIGTTTVTLAATSYKGAMTLALAGSEPPTIAVTDPDGTNDDIAQGAASYTVKYDLADIDDVVTANFYYDTDNTGLNGSAIAGCANQAEGAGATCTWNTTSLATGTYYVYGIVTDGITQVSAYSAAPVYVGRTALSGHIYSNEGSAPIDCSAGNLTVNLRVNGAGSDTGLCTANTGAWSARAFVTSGQTVFSYLSGGSVRGSNVLVSNTLSQSNVDIYQNRVILRDDANNVLTNSEIASGNTADSDDLVNLSSGVLAVDGYELHVWGNTNFTPGNSVSVTGLHLVSGATYTGGSEFLYLIGSSTISARPFILDSGGTFNAGSDTVVYPGDADADVEAANYNNLKLGFACGDPVVFPYKGAVVTYGTVQVGSYCIMDRNLGASEVATSSNDALSYGDYFQWGRLADGHQVSTSATTTNMSMGSDVPNNGGAFILRGITPFDWRSPQNNNLWQAVSGYSNNPCPSGWHVPTNAEWTSLMSGVGMSACNGTPTDCRIVAANSLMKLSSPGYRDNITGLVTSPGTANNHWTSTVSGTSGVVRTITSTAQQGSASARAVGYPVRCIKN